MSKETTDFILNSLRGRILAGAGALVVLNCFCGLLGYLAISFSGAAPVYAVIASTGAIAAVTGIYGWWLAGEILKPIEAVNMLARSLERSPSASLPKSTGASETDELLRTLHRNSQQLQNLISLMDDVACGKTEIAMAPLQNPDRLSVSFQKLVAKVTDSIKAKQQLDALQNSVNRLKSDVSGIRTGNLAVEFRGDLWQTGEIAEAFKYLIGQINELILHISSGSIAARGAADESRKALRSVIESEDSQSARINKASAAMTDSPERLRQLSENLAEAISDAGSGAGHNIMDPEIQSAAVNRLRRLLAESKKNLEKLRERATVIPQAARSAQDLARRANLVALNTSIQPNAKEGNASVLADEIASLSVRADAVSKDIMAVNESLIADIVQLEADNNALLSEISEVSEVASRSAAANAELDKHLARFKAVQIAIAATAGERIAEYEAISKALVSHTPVVDVPGRLKESVNNLETIINLTDILQEATLGFRTHALPLTSPRTEAAKLGSSIGSPGERIDFGAEN